MTDPAKCVCGSTVWAQSPDEKRIVCWGCFRPAWQSIETAPKDDTDVLVLCEDGGILIGCHCGTKWWIEQTRFEERKPTHWMPLPEPPKP